MAPTRPHRRTLHLLVPSPFTASAPPAPSAPAAATASGSNATPSSPTSPSSPPPQTKKPSRKVLALAREMAAERGEILLDPSPRAGGGGTGGGLVGAQSEAKSVKGAREWNGLLCWARKKRGPQWDAATQMWQVDFLSPEYYEPSLSVPAPPVETPLVPPPTGRSTASTDPIAPEGSQSQSQPEKLSHSGGGTSGLLDAQASSSSRSSRRRG